MSSSSIAGPNLRARVSLRIDRRTRPELGDAYRDELDLARPVRVAVPLLVGAVERLREPGAERHRSSNDWPA